MGWSLGVEPWSGVLEQILEWNEVRFGIIVALFLGQSMFSFTVHFPLDSLCFFCHVSLTCFNQALNIVL